MFKPKFFTLIKNYDKETFISDLIAGVIVGIVALPLAIAFAIASGVAPEKGIITAIVAGFLISFLGGSRVQIGGPTGAFVVIIYGVIQNYGYTGLLVSTFLAGIFLVIMGFAKLGSLIKFIPHPVIVGFTSGIALIIFSSQIKDLFGLSITKVPADFIEKWYVYFSNFHTYNYWSIIISISSLMIIIVWQKFIKKIPGSIIAIILTTIFATAFNLPVETIGSRFGSIKASLGIEFVPQINFETVKNLIQPAFTIAMLAAIESLLSALVADGMIGSKHRSNTELIAQGIANIFSSLFGGIPATGAIARTATNIKNGAKTPVAGMIHALTLLLILLFFGKYANLIPMATLAAILVVVSYNMSEWRSFVKLFKSPRHDLMVLLITFFLTVVFDLTIAIEIGLIMSVFLFMHRMSQVTNVGIIRKEFEDTEDIDETIVDPKKIPDGVEIFEINGPFFFGAVDKFKETIEKLEKLPKVRILRMRYVNAIDSTGIHTLEEFYYDCKKHNIKLIISGIHAQPLKALTDSGFFDVIGEENFCGNIDEALEKAKQYLNKKNSE